MSFSGSLEDVPVPDLVQFIHLGGRTGTLTLASGGERCEIGFHCGRIVAAEGPGSRKLGELLLASGALDHISLDAALAAQESEQPRRPLGQLLVEAGALKAEEIYAAVTGQIGEIVLLAVGWSCGTFDFSPDDLRPLDDLAIHPGELVPQLKLDTRHVLFEAMRLLDERRKKDAAEPPREAAPAEQRPRAQPVPPEASAEPAPPQPGVQIVSRDKKLVQQLLRRFQAEGLHPLQLGLRDAGTSAPGEPPPVVLIDLRAGAVPLEALAILRRSRARAPLLAIADSALSFAQVFHAGALAVLPPEVEPILACARSFVLGQFNSGPAERRGGRPRGDFSRLRRILGDLHSGLISTSITLSLMNVISESVERAVLFLVHRDELVALGAFGSGPGGQSLAQLTKGLRLPLGPRNALSDCLGDGRVRSGRVEEARLPEAFAAQLGAPRQGQYATFPVLGGQRVIAVVYVDNGQSNRPIDELEILELASAQAGLAFENELLRRQMSARP